MDGQLINKAIDPVDWLFAQLHGMFGSAFTEKYKSGQLVNGKDSGIANTQAVWSEKIRARGLKMADVRRGLEVCERMRFPPSWGEFLEACKPSIDPLKAYYEAVAGMQARKSGEMGEWSHPAVFWAAVKVSAFDLLNQSYSSVKARWESAFKDEMGKGVWSDIPEPMIALPAPLKSSTNTNSDVAHNPALKLVEHFRASDVTKSVDAKTDHKRWARKIMARHKAGDKTLPMISLQFATEALKNEQEL